MRRVGVVAYEQEGRVACAAYRHDWAKAGRALRGLVRDKGGSTHVIDIVRALSGRSTLDGYRRLADHPQGGRIAFERVELVQRLMDRDWVDGFAPGSVGAAYARFTARENLTAKGLAEEVSKGVAAAAVEAPLPYAWFGRRVRDSHDLWHVLTGYGREGLGEACLVAFCYAQTKALGWGVVALAAYLKAKDTLSGPDARHGPPRRAIWEAHQRGRRARWLLGEDYERLMAEPLATAQARLGLTPPRAYLAVPARHLNREAGTGGAEFVLREPASV
ncbi:MAG: ubiquinone biosynthesis protein [Phenylobacterium sp.]|nr:ubiquinone biosynthesis protein [Phenylobacterium sp.]